MTPGLCQNISCHSDALKRPQTVSDLIFSPVRFLLYLIVKKMLLLSIMALSHVPVHIAPAAKLLSRGICQSTLLLSSQGYQLGLHIVSPC